jgi:hypothetical protein
MAFADRVACGEISFSHGRGINLFAHCLLGVCKNKKICQTVNVFNCQLTTTLLLCVVVCDRRALDLGVSGREDWCSFDLGWLADFFNIIKAILLL